MTHTKGPWDWDGDILLNRDSGNVVIDNADYEGSWFVDYGTEYDAESNKRLISAAPDLLAVAKYARRFLNPIDHDVAFVDTAIAKATGGAK